MRADLRAAAVYATDCSREIAQWAHLIAGTTAIREGSRLERAFRDLYTGTQHAFIGEKVAIDAAQVWLGSSTTRSASDQSGRRRTGQRERQVRRRDDAGRRRRTRSGIAFTTRIAVATMPCVRRSRRRCRAGARR